MMNKNEYKNFDAIGLANLVKNREVSPHELLDLAIEITEENESEISALNTRLYEEARSYIKNELSGGSLEGVPFLVKDLNVSIKGIPTTMTCDLFKDNIADSNSRIVDTEYAKEMTEFARSQIVRQAGMAMLSQANAIPNQGLQLLQ